MDRPIVSIITGVIALIGGFLALFNPLAATLTATALAGWVFVLVGVLQIVAVFSGEGWGAKILYAIMGVVFLLLGANLLGEPLAGVLSLTLLVAILFLVGGVIKIGMSFALGLGQFWPLAVSGVLSLILASMIFTNFPGSAVVTLGLLLGVELLSTGVSLISFGLAARRSAAA